MASQTWFTRRLQQARRDFSMLVEGFRASKPPSFQVRSARRFSQSPRPVAQPLAPVRLPGLRELRVVEVIDETPNARSFALLDPNNAPIEFVPGQFLTVEVEVEGQRLRRAYSLSSRAGEGPATITVKRVAGGRVSNYLNDNLRVGDHLRVLGPSGDFGATPSEVAGRLVCIAGGSGITPIMSVVRTWICQGQGEVHLVYGNRNPSETIFFDELSRLQADYKKLHVHHVWEDGGEEGSLAGRLDVANLTAVFTTLGGVGGDDLFLVCGPEPMMAAARSYLLDAGIEPTQIREEKFSQPHLRSADAQAHEHALVSIRVGETTKTVTVKGGQTLLEAGLDAGLTMPFSCAMGGCGACRVRVVEGVVTAEEPNCLTPEERAGGYTLACVGRPNGPCQIAVEGA